MGCCQAKGEDNNEINTQKQHMSVIEDISDNEKVRAKNHLEIEKNIQPIDVPTTRRQDEQIVNDIVEDDGIKPKKRPKSKIPITVAQSEPQNLDPNNVYFIENKNVNVSPIKTKPENIAKEEVIVRQTTMEKIIEEKIKNKANFEDLLEDDRLGKLMK